MGAGAGDIPLKDASSAQLAGAVRAVRGRRETHFASAAIRRLIEDFCRGPAPGIPVGTGAERLSEWEFGVVRLVAQGLSNAEIAARRFLSEAIVESRIARALAEPDLHDRVQTAVHAYEHNTGRPGHGAPSLARGRRA